MSSKFVAWGNNLKGPIAGIVSGVIICVEPTPHIHQHGPLWPDNGYGVQAILTSTSTSASWR
jgi:hypothetical protein